MSHAPELQIEVLFSFRHCSDHHPFKIFGFRKLILSPKSLPLAFFFFFFRSHSPFNCSLRQPGLCKLVVLVAVPTGEEPARTCPRRHLPEAPTPALLPVWWLLLILWCVEGKGMLRVAPPLLSSTNPGPEEDRQGGCSGTHAPGSSDSDGRLWDREAGRMRENGFPFASFQGKQLGPYSTFFDIRTSHLEAPRFILA